MSDIDPGTPANGGLSALTKRRGEPVDQPAPARKPSILATIITELRKQSSLKACGAPYIYSDDPRAFGIDGRIDLVALADAIERQRAESAGSET